MVAWRERFGKRCEPHFAEPPWTKESPEWRQLDARLPEDHVARRMVAAMEMLDLRPLFASYSAGGSDALRPDLLLRIVLIEVWLGRQRPSQWFRDAEENFVLQWAGFGIHPARSTWYSFRDRQGPFIDQWLRRVLQIARERGVTPAERGSLDGSLLAADASYVTACNLAICEQEQVTLYGPWQENDYSDRGRNSRQRMIRKEEFTWLPGENRYRCPEGHPLKWIGREKRIQGDGQINVMHRYRCSPEDCQPCTRRTQCTKNPARGRAVKRSEHEDLIVAHRARMETEEAKAIYRLRKQTVELGYADLKENRGLRGFSGRGLTRARTEAGLNELARNLLIVERELRTRGIQNRTPQNACHDTS